MNILDRMIGYLSPELGARRLHARATMQQVQSLLGGSSKGPYAAASRNRLNKFGQVVVKENEVTSERVDNLRADSWNLYRDNPSARKIVRSLEAKVIGAKGMKPEPLAKRPDGSPHVEFRARAKELWEQLQTGFDARGLPGRGGLTTAGMQKLALRSVILSGNMLYKLRSIDAAKQKARDLPVSLTLQLVDSCRLAEESLIPAKDITTGHTVWRGIQFDGDGERVGYWINNVPIYAGAGVIGDVQFVPLEKMGHLYIEEDIDQPIGIPWFAAAILRTRNTGDLEYNVLMQSAAAACVVATYQKPTGKARLGLNQQDGNTGSDDDGNEVNTLQPMMVVDVGKDGKFELQSPNQPNMNPEAFVQHLQRGTATALPGTKASTITGDYRNSSFSSERSADNDVWPELQDVQQWFASGFCQPIWETILRNAVFNGYFDGIVSQAEFQASPGRFSSANWQGPVALSINPKDDVTAASGRVSSGLSSLQMECAKVNTDWRDVLNDVAELYSVAKEKGIPQEVVNNIMGVDAQDQIAAQQAAAEPVTTEQQEAPVNAT